MRRAWNDYAPARDALAEQPDDPIVGILNSTNHTSPDRSILFGELVFFRPFPNDYTSSHVAPAAIAVNVPVPDSGVYKIGLEFAMASYTFEKEDLRGRSACS